MTSAPPPANLRPSLVVWMALALMTAWSLSEVDRFPPAGWAVLGAGFAGLCGYGVRMSLWFQRLRHKAVRLDGDRPHRLQNLLGGAFGVATAAAVAGGGVAFGLAQVTGAHLWVSMPACVVVGLALARQSTTWMPLPDAVQPRSTTLPALLLSTGLPTGIIASVLSVFVAYVRVYGRAEVGPSFVSKHLALTFVLYGVLLGLSAFVKVYAELTSGAVVVDREAPERLPGPGAVAGVLAIFLLVIGPRVLPALAVTTFLSAKAVVGFVLGGGLSALGGWRGASAAVHGMPRGR